jgi:hypothetical protein
MKQIRFTALLALFFAVPSLFIACDDNGESTQKPVITLHEPEEGAVLKIGSAIHFEADFEGHNQLRTYNIDIHNNFTGHDHEATKSETDQKDTLNFKKTWDISGYRNIHEHHHDIEIPATTAPGKYHFIVQCADSLGNSSMVVRNIELAH